MTARICERCRLFIPVAGVHNCALAARRPGGRTGKQRTTVRLNGEAVVLKAEIRQPDGSLWLFERLAS